MRYSEQLIAPMRADLTRFGVQETKTPQEVDDALKSNGTVLVVTNSVCGCAAGKARPAVGLALKHANHPDTSVVVFAGADLEAVAHVRELLSDYPPSSPSVALFRDGKPVFFLPRHQIESNEAPQIAKMLTEAFDRYCVTAKQ